MSSALGTLVGRTRRKPSHSASVMYQMLVGSCGSRSFHTTSDFTRVVQVSFAAGSFHEPPRTAIGYEAVGFTHGLVAGPAGYGAYWSVVHSMTFPSMSCRP